MGPLFLFQISNASNIKISGRCKSLMEYENMCVTEMDRSVCVSGTSWTFSDTNEKRVSNVVGFEKGVVSLNVEGRNVDFEAESIETLLQSLCMDFLEFGNLEIPNRRRLDTSETEIARSEAATVLALTTGLVIMGLPLFWMFLLSAEVI